MAERAIAVAADGGDIEPLLLELGRALTMTGDAVSEIESHLRTVAAAYGHPDAIVAVLPTALIVAVGGHAAQVQVIDSSTQLRLDQASRGDPRRARSRAGDGFAR